MNIALIASFDFSGGLHELLGYAVRIQSIGDFMFFRLILEFLQDRINDFGIKLLGNMMKWVGFMALTLMTLWVLIQGFRIVTGRSRDSMMVLVTNMARAALIVSVATTMAMFGQNVQDFLNKDVKGLISHVVTGKDDPPEKQIDQSLAWMQVALSSIDAIQVLKDESLQGQKTQAQIFIGLGTGGPAITAGAMLLLYQIAMALFIGLGPLFILCLLFEQTKQLFQRWLFYGIGTMFSMAVLAAMVSIALDMVIRVAGSFWATALVDKYLLDGALADGMTSQAMQQGGMGLILTTLILTAPPMAAMFFQGTLGTFMAYSQIGGGAAGAPSSDGRPAGTYTPSAPSKGEADSGSRDANANLGMGRVVTPQQTGPSKQDSGLRGAYSGGQ
ncbi:type VI secretion protein [Stenotrophomonas lactitubi]|uniref:type IV secretion system protein n=1 Tax=Stenotrophomonas TaxID=40323 RepID=UPI000C27034A|nr:MULTISPECIES: type IV secretion system protein [Stenotrophomonas]MBD3681608.1 type IV secretion system protein [Stenotrophomonas sp. Br8]PJO52661.1 type VI secretion protein [Stenotrophomonas lactitubi]